MSSDLTTLTKTFKEKAWGDCAELGLIKDPNRSSVSPIAMNRRSTAVSVEQFM